MALLYSRTVTSCLLLIQQYNVDIIRMQPQSPLTSSFQPVRPYSSDDVSQYSHSDSAYVSPTSVFGEMGNGALVSGSPSEMNLSPSASSSSLFPLPEYNCFPIARDFPTASEASNRGVFSQHSVLSFPPQSRLSYPG